MSNDPLPHPFPQWNRQQRLRAAREKVTESRTEFAKASKINRKTIYNYEHGAEPSEIFLDRWARTCDVTVEWILTGIEPSDGPDGGGNVVQLMPKTGRTQQGTVSGCNEAFPLRKAS